MTILSKTISLVGLVTTLGGAAASAQSNPDHTSSTAPATNKTFLETLASGLDTTRGLSRYRLVSDELTKDGKHKETLASLEVYYKNKDGKDGISVDEIYNIRLRKSLPSGEHETYSLVNDPEKGASYAVIMEGKAKNSRSTARESTVSEPVTEGAIDLFNLAARAVYATAHNPGLALQRGIGSRFNTNDKITIKLK